MPIRVTKMLAGSFLIIRIFVDKMLINAPLFFKKKKFTEKVFENLSTISAIFYLTFEDIFKVLDPIVNNLEVIELVEHPIMRFKPILFGKKPKKIIFFYRKKFKK